MFLREFVFCSMRRFLPLFVLPVFVLVLSFSFAAVRPDGYFTKGNKLTFTITSENGAKSYAVVKISSVIPRDRTIEIDARDDRENDQHKSTFTYRLQFFSDSLNWCASALNHLSIPLVYSSNFIVGLRSDSLVYPYAMKTGDTLRHASASELINGNERFVTIHSRKVAATETVSVAGEALQAFRIEGSMTKGGVTDYGALGKIPNETKYTFTEWFVPSKGVVKSELKSATGVTSTVLQ